MGLLAWIKKHRQWHRDHIAAFAVVTKREPDGFTTFQHQCLAAVADVLPADRFERIVMTQEEGDYLVAPLGLSGAKAYIYPNEAMIFGGKYHSWFEEWGYLTPKDLIGAFLKECKMRAA